ncbi:Dynamitin-domain-containing protein [Collybia nuda]|uniref:Dynamitin-domain-containing protein n=1 Tax=Collybia nuda TaxID=64659 RepID=A0A9P5YC45_9AGAR|nr:Dynamitin-domain-containing protein [Collybia nuda]
MSGNKYADLPDIDTAPDIYETEDVFPTSQATRGDSSDEEGAPPQRSTARGRNEVNGKEEIDSSNLIDHEEASKVFRKAERKRERLRTYYAYPPSPSSPSSPTGPSANARPVPLSQRLRALQAELAALEAEIADPLNPHLVKEKEDDKVDPGELIRGLVDVRGRLDKIRKGKEGRGKLVGVVLGEEPAKIDVDETSKSDPKKEKEDHNPKSDLQNIVDMDHRVGELEKLVGSSSTTLDETSPLPPPLLPLITRLNTQLTLLTQPRHIDSISRRLKLLLSDLDRASVQHHSHRRHPSQPAAPSSSSQMQEQILPLLSRLGPSLPHIPHILARLRTLSSLHTSAAEFQGTLEGLEQEQLKMREALNELEGAVETVEKSLEDNRGVIKGNVAGLESRVEALLERLEQLSRTDDS